MASEKNIKNKMTIEISELSKSSSHKFKEVRITTPNESVTQCTQLFFLRIASLHNLPPLRDQCGRCLHPDPHHPEECKPPDLGPIQVRGQWWASEVREIRY